LEKRSLLSIIVVLVFIFTIISCNSTTEDTDTNSFDIPPEHQSGFIQIPSITYSLNCSLFKDIKSSPVSIFYSFQTADRDDFESSPVFVFFNGGPGAATSGNLLSMNTTDRTFSKLVTGEDLDAANPYSWRKLGNLLYIDAPGTGFSYTHSLYNHPCSNDGERYNDYWVGKNYNPYIDADLMVRALLEALRINHVQRNKVILVGESYGGTRTSLMLNMLLLYNNYGKEAADRVFWDESLPAVIKAYYNEISGTVQKEFTPAEIAKLQFGSHILIQPQLTGWRQTRLAGDLLEAKGSIIYQLAEQEKKEAYVPCSESHTSTCYIPLMGGPYLNVLNYVTETLGLDTYNYLEKKGWTDELEAHTAKSLNNLDALRRLLIYDPELISEMYASYRKKNNAYKYLDKVSSTPELVSINDDLVPAFAKAWAKTKTEIFTEETDFKKVFGELESCDGYIKVWDPDQCYAYYMNMAWINIFFQFWSDWTKIGKFRLDPEADEFGRLFLYNLTVVDVMITNAAYDFMVYSPSLPQSFAGYTEVERVAEDEQTDYFTIYYNQTTRLEGVPATVKRSIFHPSYTDSGHAVSISEPEKLRQDVADFLNIDIAP
jgi:pimeloyl-ACP methyl ester carboxylesterase